MIQRLSGTATPAPKNAAPTRAHAEDAEPAAVQKSL